MIFKILTLVGLTIITTNALSTECVILLHGLARTDTSMKKIERALTADEYFVVNTHYPSRKKTIEELAEQTIPSALAQCPENTKVHFVSHSMGGILIRQYLATHTIDNLHHVIMLGPPNKGSEVVDKYRDVPGYKLINGPAGLQLGTETTSVPNLLGPANFSLGVIAGRRSVNLILSRSLPNPDDGKVSVESTKLEGMSDHIVLPVTHPFMMKNKTVIAQIKYFLIHGKFERN